MFTAAVTLCVLAAAPNPAPVKLAATTFNVIDIPASRADFFTDHFADRLSEQGLTITTPREIASVLGLERQKQLLGCGEDSQSCLAEIANALGVDGVVMGDVANLGGTYHVNIKVVGSSDGQKLAAFSASATSEGEVLEVLGAAAVQLARDVKVALGREVAPKPARISRSWFWAPAAVGAVALGAGTYGLLSAQSAKQRLETESFGPGQAEQVLSDGQTMRTLGYVGVGVGAAAAAGAVALFVLGEPPPVTATVSAGPNGAGVSIGGVLPW